ncbi:MAG: hypothetical protein K8T25_11540 [Planctomycetia bacterium]|nr:hypothetical protein [Planctomycetia bacterium]
MPANRVIDTLRVYEQGVEDPDNLSRDERMVYLLIEFQTYIDMEGWDHFFQTDKMRYYKELKGALKKIKDIDSLSVIENYEQELRSNGIAMDPTEISEFLDSQEETYLSNRCDWRESYSQRSDERWQKCREYLHKKGFELKG